MPLITVNQYRAHVNDNTPYKVGVLEYALERAVGLVEDFLGRRLVHGLYTETLELTKHGRCYPAAVPVTSLPASTDARMLGDDCIDVAPYWHDFIIEHSWDLHHTHEHTATLTYEGGFTWDNLPMAIKDAICAIAWASINGKYNPTDRKAFATQVRVGDVALGFPNQSKGSKDSHLDRLVPGTSERLRGYRLGRL